MIDLALAGVASFSYVGLKAFQQRNVVSNDFKLVVLTSNLIAFAEVFLIARIAAQGYYLPLVVTIGMSAGLGCVTAMTFHNWLKRKER